MCCIFLILTIFIFNNNQNIYVCTAVCMNTISKSIIREKKLSEKVGRTGIAGTEKTGWWGNKRKSFRQFILHANK